LQSGGALDDQRELAPRLAEVGQRLADAAAEDLLVQLRELAADGDAPIAQNIQQVRQRRQGGGEATPAPR
jgi:hypothetical protein